MAVVGSYDLQRLLKASSRSLQPAKLAAGSHVASAAGYPSHCVRYTSGGTDGELVPGRARRRRYGVGDEAHEAEADVGMKRRTVAAATCKTTQA